MQQTASRLEVLRRQLEPVKQVSDSTPLARAMTATPSVWAHVEQGPDDAILGLNEKFKADPSPNKLNLGVGAYRDADGKPYVLNAVRKAEMQIVTNPSMNKEYLPITGIPEFCKLAQGLAFGDVPAVAEGRIISVQALSGTGSLRVGSEFLAKFYPKPTIYVCKPTWGNHLKIFPSAGLKVEHYRYYAADTKALDFTGMMADISAMEPGSIILLHACAHNPTGVDPSQEQWQQILAVCQERQLLCFFDSAYQGFASGDLERDAYALRLFARSGVPMLLAQSFAKNMGLYGERAGALHLVCSSPEEAGRVLSQVKLVVRAMYSSPPRHGASIACEILKNAALYQEWCVELKMMADRINEMRQELYKCLQEKAVPGSWENIINQIGMFSYTGLTKPQVQNMIEKWHIYLTADGRISMAGLNKEKCNYLADAMLDSVSNF